MRKNKKNQGFTLIELLIVIAIIGILAAVLIPNLLNARRSAVDTGAEAYARNCVTAAASYIISNSSIDAALDCEADLDAGAKPDYVTSAQTSADGSEVTVQYTGGTNSEVTLPTNF